MLEVFFLFFFSVTNVYQQQQHFLYICRYLMSFLFPIIRTCFYIPKSTNSGRRFLVKSNGWADAQLGKKNIIFNQVWVWTRGPVKYFPFYSIYQRYPSPRVSNLIEFEYFLIIGVRKQNFISNLLFCLIAMPLEYRTQKTFLIFRCICDSILRKNSIFPA